MPDGSAPAPRRGSKISRAAFSSLFRQHHAFVWRCVRRFGVAPASVEDAVQEVFVTAYQRLHTFEGRASIEAWLGGIARRIAFRFRRTEQRRQRRLQDYTTIPVVVEELDDALRRGDAGRFLDAFLETLDPAKRSAFVLYELEGLKGREVADALGINPNTAHARLRAARALFAEACAQAQAQELAIEAQLITRAHRQEHPPKRVLQRGWMAFVAETGWKASSVAASGTATMTSAGSWLGQLKVAALTVAIGTGGLVAADRVVSASEPHPQPAARDNRADRSVPTSNATSTRPPTAGAVPAPVAPTLPTRSLADTSAPARTFPMSSPSDASPAPGELSPEELSLLSQANRATRDGDWSRVLEATQGLLTRYPTSDLGPEATVLRVKALCALDEPSRAERAAGSLDRDRASRLLAKYCPPGSSARSSKRRKTP